MTSILPYTESKSILDFPNFSIYEGKILDPTIAGCLKSSHALYLIANRDFSFENDNGVYNVQKGDWSGAIKEDCLDLDNPIHDNFWLDHSSYIRNAKVNLVNSALINSNLQYGQMSLAGTTLINSSFQGDTTSYRVLAINSTVKDSRLVNTICEDSQVDKSKVTKVIVTQDKLFKQNAVPKKNQEKEISL